MPCFNTTRVLKKKQSNTAYRSRVSFLFFASTVSVKNIFLFFQVRVHCLVCLGKIVEHLDKYAVQDEILPLLPQIPSREAATLMAILGESSKVHILLSIRAY